LKSRSLRRVKSYQEHEIRLYAGDDHHPVSMACYDKERFYIGGLRAQLETLEEDTIVFAVTVETEHQGWITRRYGLTGEQFCHLLYGVHQPTDGQRGLLEATTRQSHRAKSCLVTAMFVQNILGIGML
jgi:hypothetical protein